MKHLLAFVPLLLLPACSETPADARSGTTAQLATPSGAADTLFGTTYKDISEIPQLNGYKHEAGALLDVRNSDGDYAFSVGQYRKGGQTLLLFNELARYEDSRPVWTLRDTVHAGSDRAGAYMTLCNCEQHEVPDKAIVAIVRDEDKPYFTGIAAAWRADTDTKQFIRLPSTEGIRCINEGYGCE